MYAFGEKWEATFHFAEEGSEELRQIALDDPELIKWRGQKVIGLRLHEALALMGDATVGARWRPEDATLCEFDDLQPLDRESFSDESLVDDGTLWFPQRCMALVMCGGEVTDVVWRRAVDVPREFAGPFTEAQRLLSERPDLERHLRRTAVEAAEASSSGGSPSGLRGAYAFVTVVFLFLAASGGSMAFKEGQTWRRAPIVDGKLVAREPRPGKPWDDRFIISYTDPTGRSKQATMERTDFYVPPKEPGDAVRIAWLPGEPDRVRGLPQVYDGIFIRYAPWFMVLGALYVVALTISGFIGRLRSTAPPAASQAQQTPSPFMPDRGR